MKGKDTAIGIGVVIAIVAAIVYANHQSESPESQLGPAPYIAGPNAENEQCKNLTQEQGSILDRQTNEDTQAENRDNYAYEQVMHAQMTDAEREIAINNLSAKEDIAKTAREARQNNEVIQLRAKALEAGCLIPNPNF
jgi:hypothetical protein